MEYEYSKESVDKDSETKQESKKGKLQEKEKDQSTEGLLLRIINRLDKLEAQYEVKADLARSNLADRS